MMELSHLIEFDKVNFIIILVIGIHDKNNRHDRKSLYNRFYWVWIVFWNLSVFLSYLELHLSSAMITMMDILSYIPI